MGINTIFYPISRSWRNNKWVLVISNFNNIVLLSSQLQLQVMTDSLKQLHNQISLRYHLSNLMFEEPLKIFCLEFNCITTLQGQAVLSSMLSVCLSADTRHFNSQTQLTVTALGNDEASTQLNIILIKKNKNSPVCQPYYNF